MGRFWCLKGTLDRGVRLRIGKYVGCVGDPEIKHGFVRVFPEPPAATDLSSTTTAHGVSRFILKSCSSPTGPEYQPSKGDPKCHTPHTKLVPHTLELAELRQLSQMLHLG